MVPIMHGNDHTSQSLSYFIIHVVSKDSWVCMAYSTGESYNIELLRNHFNKNTSTYEIAELPKGKHLKFHLHRFDEATSKHFHFLIQVGLWQLYIPCRADN